MQFYGQSWIKQERISNGGKRKPQSPQQMVLGKLDKNVQKNENGPLPYTIHKNKFRTD